MLPSRKVLFTLIAISCCSLAFTASAQTGGYYIYRLAPNETLTSVANQFLLDAAYLKRLQTYNRIRDPATRLPAGTTITIPAAWVTKSPGLAKVKTLQGKAEIIPGHGGHPHPLASYAYLSGGDTIRTDDGSSLSLEFTDGSKLLLAPASELTLARLGVDKHTGALDTRVQLRKGRVETQVVPFLRADSRFEIATPSGITSVRGTDFRVNADQANNEARTEVLRGRVNVNSNKRNRPLTTGYGTIAATGSAPTSPIPLLPAPDLSGLPIVFEHVPMAFEVPDLQGAKAYRMQIASNPEFTAVIFDAYYRSTTIRGPSLPDGDYYLRVRGIDKQRLEGYNAQFNFILNVEPIAPVLQNPKPDAELTETNPTFSWSNSSKAESYYFQLARDENFLDLLVNAENVRATSFTLAESLKPGVYYWRVASANAKEGFGPFSKKQILRKIMTPSRDE